MGGKGREAVLVKDVPLRVGRRTQNGDASSEHAILMAVRLCAIRRILQQWPTHID
jgi:hypothetical protein